MRATILQSRNLLLHQTGFTTNYCHQQPKGVLLPYFSPLPIKGGLVSVALSRGLIDEQKSIEFLLNVYILVPVRNCLFLPFDTPIRATQGLRVFGLSSPKGAII